MLMFDYSITHWMTFFTAAILLNLAPGPDMAFILGQTAKRGVQSGFAAIFGIWTGALFVWLGIKLATSDRILRRKGTDAVSRKNGTDSVFCNRSPLSP